MPVACFVGCRSKHLGGGQFETGKLVFTAPIGERWTPMP